MKRGLRDSIYLFLISCYIFGSALSAHCQDKATQLDWHPRNEVNFFTYPELAYLVQGIAQDKQGYLWIGSTDGLFRFDGISYTRFVHHDSDFLSLGSNNCILRCIDSGNNIWLTTSAGLCIMNLNNYKCRNLLFSDTLFNDMISAVAEGRDKNIWIASYGKKNLTKYEPARNKFTSYSIPDSLYINHIRTAGLTFNTDGKIYVAADYGVMVFNPQTENYERRIPRTNPDKPGKLLNAGIASPIFSDGSGDLFVGEWATQGEGLYFGKYDRGKQYIPYLNIADKNEYCVVFSIAEKTPDELWIGTDKGGLIVYNKKDGHRNFIRHKPDDPKSFPAAEGGESHYIYKDRTKCFWFNSNNKIVKAEPADQLVKSYDLAKQFGIKESELFAINSIKKFPSKNKMLIATFNGAGLYELDFGKNKLMKKPVKGNYQTGEGALSEFLQDAKGRLWACNANQVLLYD